MSEHSGGAGEGAGWISSREVYRGRLIELTLDRVRFPDGSTGELEMIRHKGAAAVLPVFGAAEESDPEILLLRQYRYAAGGELYEVPAGIRDPEDASWEACARRELEEETGYRAGSLEPLTHIYTTPGFTDEVIHLFLARNLSEGERALEADEFAELVRLRLSTALAWIGEGRIVDGKSVVTILYARTFLLRGDGEVSSGPE